jgi:hypothetical protein
MFNANYLKSLSLIIFSLLLSLPLLVQAQSVREQVSGVDVSLEQISSGRTQTARTDDKGKFTFSDVAPGTYRLRIGCTGASAQSPTASSGTMSSGGQGAQGDSRRCYAEFRVEVTDKSKGHISGVVERGPDRK